MKKKNPYLSPQAEIVRPASFLCGNTYGNDEGYIALGSSTLDASMGEAKTAGFDDEDEEEEETDIEITSWWDIY